MSSNAETSGYLSPSKPRKTRLDPHQQWVEDRYRELIRRVLTENPKGLRFEEIVLQSVETRREWEEHEKILRRIRQSASPKIQARIYQVVKERKLPGSQGISPKIVRKHLRKMQAEKTVVKVMDRYVLLQAPPFDFQLLDADVLNEKVSKIIGRKPFSNWNFVLSPGAAGCYLLGLSDTSKNSPYEEILEDKSAQFEEDFFWLDELLEFGITNGYLAESMFSAKRNWLDAKELKKGWKSCFSNYGLIVLAFAVDPDKLLEFLATPIGESFAVGYLNERWQSIVDRANKKKRSRPTEEQLQRLKEACRVANEKEREWMSR